MNNIGNKQFLDETGLGHVFTLIKEYFNKYVSKKDFIETELVVSEALNDLNQRIETLDIPDTAEFATKTELSTEVQILNDKIDNLDIESDVTSVNGQTGAVIIDIPDTSNLATKDELSEEVQILNDKIDNLDIESDVTSVNGQTGAVIIDIPDTSNLATKTELSEEVQTLNDKIDNLPTGTNLQAGNNITIGNDNKINADGYIYTNTSNTAGSISLNNSNENTNQAKGDYTTVLGWNCRTSDGNSSANSFCGGDSCVVSNEDCFVYGKGLKTIESHQTIIGCYNSTLNLWNPHPIFEIGYGTSDTNRKTLFTVLKNGYCATSDVFGTGTTNADFAEYFEWVDGNPDNEDRIGYMVQLNGEKIEISNTFTHCIGVVTGTGAFIGDSASLDWRGRYMRDEWGRIIYEEDENGEKIAKENPDYDSNREYIPRMYRKEWAPIGLVGKVHVRQDGTLKVGGFAGCKNGIATDATKGYRVLSIINENIALVLVK